MTIMWSAVSFTTYLLHFQLKYLQGSIFINDYYCGLSDTMAVIFGGLIFSRLGLKNTYYFAYAMGLAGGIGILYLELSQIKMISLGLTPAETLLRKAAISAKIPYCVLVAKFGIEIGFLTSYFASFTDDRVFPIEKRATAIGTCKFIARGLTALAPLVNELPDPIPMSIFVVTLGIAFIYNTTLNLPSTKEI